MNIDELPSHKRIYDILDKLEQRIAKLEKVLASHAKTIGEIREEDIKTWVNSGKGQY